MFPVWISINAIFLLLIPTSYSMMFFIEPCQYFSDERCCIILSYLILTYIILSCLVTILSFCIFLSCLVSSYHKNEYKTMVGVFHRCLIRKMWWLFHFRYKKAEWKLFHSASTYSTGWFNVRDFWTSRIRWLEEPRKRKVKSLFSKMNGPSTRTSHKPSSSFLSTSEQSCSKVYPE